MNISFWSQQSGPILTLVTIAIIELLSQTVFSIPNPAPIYLTSVVYATFSGSFPSGWISATITLVYALWFFSTPGELFHYADANAHSVLVLALTTPALVLMVGFLKHRVEKAVQLETANTILQQQLVEMQQVEVELRNANDRFHLAAEAVNGIIYDWDITKNYAERTKGLTEVLGYQLPEAEATPEWWAERIHPEDRERVQEEIKQALALESSFTIEYRVCHKSDRYLYVWDRGLIVRDASHAAVRVVGCTLDISDRFHATMERDRLLEQLETERALLEAVLQQMPAGAIVAEAPSGKLILGNDQVDRIWRHPFLTSANIQEYHEYKGFHPDGRSYEPQEWPLARSISTGEVVMEEDIEVLRGDGTRGTMRVSSSPVRSRTDAIVAGVVIFSDISDRKRNKALMKAQNTVLEMIASGAPLSQVLDVLTRLIEEQSDGALCSILLLDKEGKKLFFAAAPSLPESYQQVIADGLPIGENAGSCGTSAYRREPVIVSDIANDPLWAGFSHVALSHGLQACWSLPIFATQGEVLGTFGMYYRTPRSPNSQEWKLIEISAHLAAIAIERQRSQEALVKSEARFRRLAESNILGVIVADFSGNITDANDAFLQMVGYTREEFNQGKVRWDTMTPPEYLPLDEEKILELQASGSSTSWEKEYICKDGSRISILVGIALLEEPENTCVCFVLDLTERKLLEESLRQQAQDLEQANRIKDEFLAVVSHELRTPLNAMLGWATLLRSRKFNEETTSRALETIERNAKSQVKLIEDILDVSRLMQGKIRLNICPVELKPLIEACINTVLPSCEAKGIILESVIGPVAGFVSGDAERLQQIIWNLLANAIKFTSEGGRVTVELSVVKEELASSNKLTTLPRLNVTTGTEELSSYQVAGLASSNNLTTLPRLNVTTGTEELSSSQVAGLASSNNLTIPSDNLQTPINYYAQIQISDTGIGLSPEFLPFIFERFRQADSTTTRSHSGLGLGLAIVRQLVELHGGTIKATSPGEGLGSTFTVKLPLQERGLLTRDKQDFPISNSQSPVSLKGLQILVVDDEADTREFLTTAITQYGGKVLAVASTREALKALEQFQPNVLVSDIGMPLEDGYSLIRQVRSRLGKQQLPALALSAYSTETDSKRAIAAGFHQHLAKPVDATELVEAIAKLLP
ncbi:PAS domain-containing protein [Trichocoleus sp. FACHB-90]|uniref:PAS domain-containing protein n=1 Tax=Cyanophyceae TaxID=3028117 RepID=UPI0016868F66|nr:PAS domain-containing protein [Trichocoleus sp. FACHB-90]MBD1929649.1 PAS domain-containing protein [Trichocoleus sp. FACHB-90]